MACEVRRCESSVGFVHVPVGRGSNDDSSSSRRSDEGSAWRVEEGAAAHGRVAVSTARSITQGPVGCSRSRGNCVRVERKLRDSKPR